MTISLDHSRKLSSLALGTVFSVGRRSQDGHGIAAIRLSDLFEASIYSSTTHLNSSSLVGINGILLTGLS